MRADKFIPAYVRVKYISDKSLQWIRQNKTVLSFEWLNTGVAFLAFYEYIVALNVTTTV
jgi:hypothetical protein